MAARTRPVICLMSTMLSRSFRAAELPGHPDRQPDLSLALLVPPNIQVEEGVHYFSLNLPQSPGELSHRSSAMCCRNNTITNIYNPEDTGASFSVEITWPPRPCVTTALRV